MAALQSACVPLGARRAHRRRSHRAKRACGGIRGGPPHVQPGPPHVRTESALSHIFADRHALTLACSRASCAQPRMTSATIKLAAFDFKLTGLARSDSEGMSRVRTGRLGRRRPVCPFSRGCVFVRSPALRPMNEIEIMSLRSASAIAIGLSARAVSRAQTEPSGPDRGRA